MAKVSLHQVSKSYGGSVAVEAFNLDVRDGEFLVLLGPSGCGKSTTLRMIAGLESITSGDLLIGGTKMNHVDPKDRGVAMVFQNYALYPHKSVSENMGMALKLQKLPKSQIEERVASVANMLGLTEYLDRKPGSLSGGQRQRVAIGRAIVRTPEVFLFDEPLSNLDAKLRVKMRMELQELHDRLGVTSVYVTHDQVEAMTLADRIVIMDGGVIAQVGTPREVYDKPATEFVAGFIGSPAMNFIPMQRNSDGGWYTDNSKFTLPKLPGRITAITSAITVGIRPEHLTILTEQHATDDAWVKQGKVMLAELLGADALLTLSVSGEVMTARVNGVNHPEQGQTLSVRVNPEQLHAFDPKTKKAL